MEINSLADVDDAQSIRTKAAQIPYSLLTFIGATEHSVKIICQAQRPDGSLPATREERETFLVEAYDKLHYIYSTQLQMTVDNIKPQLDSSCYVSVDEGAILTDNAVPIIVTVADRTPHLHHTEMKVSSKELPLFKDRGEAETQRLLFHYCLLDALNDTRLEKGDDAEEKVLNVLAKYCCESGLPMAMCMKLIKYNPDYGRDDLLVENIFTAVYHKKLIKIYPYKHLVKSQLLVFRQQIFMDTYYQFRKNILSGVIEFRHKDGFNYSFSPITDADRNTMTIRALKHGLDSWDKDLKRYLESTEIPLYDPIDDYLSHLPKWDGGERVEELAKRIPTDNGNFAHCFHIWMLSMVAHWMGRMSSQANALVPLLIGSQGCGKSSFCAALLPDELQPYYNDRIDFRNETSMLMGLTNFALINIDEFDSVSRGKQPLLKYLISTPAVKMRMPYQTSISNRRRYASFIATTNSRKPLKDLTGSRRFLCVEINGNIDFLSPIDYGQLYAQLVEEIAAGARFYFNEEETRGIMEMNQRFVDIDDLELLIDSLFRKPNGMDDFKEVSLPEVVELLKPYDKQLRGNRQDLIRIGRILRMKGFEVKRTATGMKYKVINGESAAI